MPALGASLCRRVILSSLRRVSSSPSPCISQRTCYRESPDCERPLFTAAELTSTSSSSSPASLSSAPATAIASKRQASCTSLNCFREHSDFGSQALIGTPRSSTSVECTAVERQYQHSGCGVQTLIGKPRSSTIQCTLFRRDFHSFGGKRCLAERRNLLQNGKVVCGSHCGQPLHLLGGCCDRRTFSSGCRVLPPKEVKAALSAAPVADSFAAIEVALDSIVKVFTVSSSPNYFLPWQNKPQREITGSGFVISGKRIITNAHVVADQTFVKVRKHGSPEKFKAKVEAVGHECDLALLTVEEEEFWDGMQCLELGNIPFLQEAVAVVGYPQGGDNISVTGGVVSRVEPTQYVHGASHLMAIQIDAAINPGNSGGPALMEDKVVGVAFQNLANSENIGYIIPVPVINHFLEDVEEKGKYVGFCTLGLTCQATENTHLREHLKMPAGMTGVLVSKVHPLTDTHRWIKKDDVILAFDGCTIANDGTVHFRNKERITFDHLVSMKKAGETGLVRVLRDGKELEFMIKLGPIRPLVPIHQFDQLPSFFIFAGFVFTPLTQPYLHEYGDEWYNTSPRRLCDRALYATPKKFGEQIVVLSQVLVDDINAGYERLAELQVKKVNGVDILNVRHLRQMVDGCRETSIRFDLEDGRVVVLNYQDAKEASFRILDRHRIPVSMSKDLMLETPGEDLEDWEKADDTSEDRVAESVC